MSNLLNSIRSKDLKWSAIYLNLSPSLDSVLELDEDGKTDRLYQEKLPTLGKYLKVLSNAEFNIKQQGRLKLLMGMGNEFLEGVKYFEDSNKEVLTRLEGCNECSCLKCIKQCEFSGCSQCRSGSFVKECKDTLNLIVQRDYYIDLKNNDTYVDNRFRVLAIIESIEYNNLYIALMNINDSDDKLLLRLVRGLRGDSYEEITDVKEFNLVIDFYESVN